MPLGASDTALRKMDPCPLGAYILEGGELERETKIKMAHICIYINSLLDGDNYYYRKSKIIIGSLLKYKDILH